MFPISLKRMHFSPKNIPFDKTEQFIPQKRKLIKSERDSDLIKITSLKILMYVSINHLHVAD